MSGKRSPIARLVDAGDLRCTICNKPRGTCGCWATCTECGWFFEEGTKCRNPVHGAPPRPLRAVAMGKFKL